MASPSTLAIIERYEEYRHALNGLVASIVTGIANPALFENAAARDQAVRCAGKHFPFIDLLYLLDADGVQSTPNLPVRKGHAAAGQFAVLLLGYAALRELTEIFTATHGSADLHLKPFGVIIFITLGLAVFDLGKTILEEEVLMHKDVYRHSSTRRTITRFMAAILIAVSIEGLLLMFKSAVGDGQHVLDGVWMMATAVGLLVGLGLYVYLGALAEQLLLSHKTKTGTMKAD